MHKTERDILKKIMKATLEFNLPDDNIDYTLCNNGYKWFAVAYEMKELFRSKLKYAELNDEQYAIVQELQQRFFDEIHERGLNFE